MLFFLAATVPTSHCCGHCCCQARLPAMVAMVATATMLHQDYLQDQLNKAQAQEPKKGQAKKPAAKS